MFALETLNSLTNDFIFTVYLGLISPFFGLKKEFRENLNYFIYIMAPEETKALSFIIIFIENELT